jgi:hypothetical protein
LGDENLLLIEEGIASALAADGGDFAVARIDERVVGKLQKLLRERLHYFLERAAPKIGAANAASKQRVPSKELRLAELNGAGVLWQEKANAAGSVAGSVEDVGMVAAPLEGVAIFQEVIDGGEFWRAHAEKRGLNFHGVVEREIVVVHHDGGASVLMELGEAADVIDVSMSADNSFDGEFVTAEKAKDAFDFVTGIDHNGFMSFGITDDGAVALQGADGDFDVDHLRIGGVGRVEGVGHWEKYSIGSEKQRFTTENLCTEETESCVC